MSFCDHLAIRLGHIPVLFFASWIALIGEQPWSILLERLTPSAYH
jgi:hypothetical protein